MNFWLVNESAPHYNLGLEKARRWLIRQGHEVTYAPFSMEAQAADAVWFSIIFSWHLPQALDRAALAVAWGKAVEIGGPATAFNAALIERRTGIKPHVGIDTRFDQEPGEYLATFTHRGCPRHCPWCIVPRAEGTLVEVPDFIPARLVHDNNFTATSEAHQVRAIERLAQAVPKVDFNQGWDARLFDQWHLDLYRRCNPVVWRFAFDFWGIEEPVKRVCKLLQRAGILNRNKVLIYCLVGFGEGLEKDIARVQRIAELGAYPFVMRYVPLDSLTKRPTAKGWPAGNAITQLSRYYNLPMVWTSGHDLERWLKGIKPAQAQNGQLPLAAARNSPGRPLRLTEKTWVRPREFNIRLMATLKAQGKAGHAYGGITLADGTEVACPTEEDVFRHLGWNWVPPEARR